MTLILWIVRVLVMLLVVRLLVRAFSSRPAVGGRRSPRRQAERLGGTLVRDPQCGTYVPRERAPSLGRGDQTVYFCSSHCRNAWAEAHRS